MVAAARFRRAQERVEQARPYAATINELLEGLAEKIPTTIHPYLATRPVKKRALVVFSSDRGLCGAFNSSLIRATEAELRKDLPTTLILIGRKVQVYFGKRNHEIYKMADAEFWSDFSHEKATALAAELGKGFIQGDFDRVDLLFNEYLSAITQKPKVETLLPISPGEKKETEEGSYLFEPNREEIVRALVPRAMEVRFSLPCLNSLAGEHGARMSAMDFATRNAGEMIDELTLKVNRARQAQITSELSEIVTSAEAMK